MMIRGIFKCSFRLPLSLLKSIKVSEIISFTAILEIIKVITEFAVAVSVVTSVVITSIVIITMLI